MSGCDAWDGGAILAPASVSHGEMSEAKKLACPAFEVAGRRYEIPGQSQRDLLVMVQPEACVLALWASLLPEAHVCDPHGHCALRVSEEW